MMTTEPVSNDAEVIDLTGLSDSSDVDEEESVENAEYSGSESDDGSEIEITLNGETRTQLQAAIDTVSETRLRHILHALVESDVNIEAAMTRELVTMKRGTQNIVPRWEKCTNCDEEFDTNTYREEEECVFHPGEVDVLEDKFADWDSDCHGDMDTLENRKNFPENFVWTCCDSPLKNPGCIHGQHQPMVIRKRKRIDE